MSTNIERKNVILKLISITKGVQMATKEEIPAIIQEDLFHYDGLTLEKQKFTLLGRLIENTFVLLRILGSTWDFPLNNLRCSKGAKS